MLRQCDVETGGRRVFDPNDVRDIELVASVTERHPVVENVDWDREFNRLDRLMRSNRHCRL